MAENLDTEEAGNIQDWPWEVQSCEKNFEPGFCHKMLKQFTTIKQMIEGKVGKVDYVSIY